MFGRTFSKIARTNPGVISQRTAAVTGTRSFHASSALDAKVCVVGAAGGIGQPLSLLMKLNKNVTDVSLYDLAPITPGVAADCSHVNTGASVSGYIGDDLDKAVKDCDVVIVPAGVPRKPGMTRDDLFNINASIVANIAKTCAKECPNASLLIISNPVNSTVPIAATVLEKEGVYNKNKLFGVTTLDVCRANTFVAENQNLNVDDVDVPVIGGHAGITILPLLSQVPNTNFSQEHKEALTHRIMFGGDEVVKAKAGGGSATLSMAYAGAVFADKVIRAQKGEEGIKACTYVESDVGPTRFFSLPVTLGTDGVAEVHEYGELDSFEQEKLNEMIPELEGSIQKGIDFVNNM